MKKFILFDHDGVLVDTEYWYFKAGERALSDIGFQLDVETYLSDMAAGLGTWRKSRPPASMTISSSHCGPLGTPAIRSICGLTPWRLTACAKCSMNCRRWSQWELSPPRRELSPPVLESVLSGMPGIVSFGVPTGL